MKKILIIEDDSAIAEIEKDYLTLSGLDAAIITDGKKGLEEAQSGLYDLILLDLMLPGMDGYQVCREIATNPMYRSSCSLQKEKFLIRCSAWNWVPTII